MIPDSFTDEELLVPGRITNIFGLAAHTVALGAIVAARRQGLNVALISTGKSRIQLSNEPYEGDLRCEQAEDVHEKVRAIMTALKAGYKLIVLDLERAPSEETLEVRHGEAQVWARYLGSLSGLIRDLDAKMLMLDSSRITSSAWKFYPHRRIEADLFDEQIRLRFVKDATTQAQGAVYSSAFRGDVWVRNREFLYFPS